MSGGISRTSARVSHDAVAHSPATKTGTAKATIPQPVAQTALIRCSRLSLPATAFAMIDLPSPPPRLTRIIVLQ
jgi:hypothetical protein